MPVRLIAVRDAVPVGARVRKVRLRANLTQQQLADAVGVHRTTVNRIEQGRLVPSLTLLGALARALGVMPATLLRGV